MSHCQHFLLSLVGTMLLLGCNVGAATLTPTSTPTPIWVVVTVTPSPTPKPTPTPWLWPTLGPPEVSRIWGDVELFSLLRELENSPHTTTQKYIGQQVAIKQSFRANITSPKNAFWIGGEYAYNEPIGREFHIYCKISPVESRHLPLLAEIETMKGTYFSIFQTNVVPPILQIEGTIKYLSLNNGGMVLRVDLDDCDVSAIGNRIVG